MIERIADPGDFAVLPRRLRLAVATADAVVTDPAGTPAALRSDLLDEFTPGEIVELVLTTALASAFSRAAIAWGPPEAMPTLEVPTPTPDPARRYDG
jgi:alkylhydroperoxidase family enzyme